MPEGRPALLDGGMGREGVLAGMYRYAPGEGEGELSRSAMGEALEDIRRILASREALYARADAVVDTAARSVKQSLKDLERAVPAATKEKLETA